MSTKLCPVAAQYVPIRTASPRWPQSFKKHYVHIADHERLVSPVVLMSEVNPVFPPVKIQPQPRIDVTRPSMQCVNTYPVQYLNWCCFAAQEHMLSEGQQHQEIVSHELKEAKVSAEFAFKIY